AVDAGLGLRLQRRRGRAVLARDPGIDAGRTATVREREREQVGDDDLRDFEIDHRRFLLRLALSQPFETCRHHTGWKQRSQFFAARRRSASALASFQNSDHARSWRSVRGVGSISIVTLYSRLAARSGRSTPISVEGNSSII